MSSLYYPLLFKFYILHLPVPQRQNECTQWANCAFVATEKCALTNRQYRLNRTLDSSMSHVIGAPVARYCRTCHDLPCTVAGITNF